MTPAIQLLKNLNITFSINEYEHPADERGYGEAAAAALQQDPKQVFKTLMAVVDGDQRNPAVAIIPVADTLDLKKLAAASGGRKAQMAEPSLAQKRSGYVVGGISPFGQKFQHHTLLDESASCFDTIYVSAGKRGLQLAVTPADVLLLTQGQLVPLARIR